MVASEGANDARKSFIREHEAGSRVSLAGRRQAVGDRATLSQKSAPQKAHMLKTIMAAAAVSTLALTSAMAQTTNPPAGSTPSTSTPPAATTTPATPAPSASNTSAAGKAHFVAKQTQDQWLATKFKGT